jgi:hypothetical protein
MKNKRLIAILGVILNLICATFLTLTAIRHPHWETLQLSPDARRAYYEKLLNILCDQTLPWTVAAMVVSAIFFWILRKDK